MNIGTVATSKWTYRQSLDGSFSCTNWLDQMLRSLMRSSTWGISMLSTGAWQAISRFLINLLRGLYSVQAICSSEARTTRWSGGKKPVLSEQTAGQVPKQLLHHRTHHRMPISMYWWANLWESFSGSVSTRRCIKSRVYCSGWQLLLESLPSSCVL